MAANPVAREPVLSSVVAAVLMFLAARYGLDLSPEQAASAAGVLIGVLAPFVRQLVTPAAPSPPQTLLPLLTADGCADRGRHERPPHDRVTR
jgi:hypothetical protein